MNSAVDKQYPRLQEVRKAYALYVKPLEAKHKGEYVVITPDGKTIFNSSLIKAVEGARKISTANNFIFKVGDKVLGTLR